MWEQLQRDGTQKPRRDMFGVFLRSEMFQLDIMISRTLRYLYSGAVAFRRDVRSLYRGKTDANTVIESCSR